MGFTHYIHSDKIPLPKKEWEKFRREFILLKDAFEDETG
jgi:hypothetical protein